VNRKGSGTEGAPVYPAMTFEVTQSVAGPVHLGAKSRLCYGGRAGLRQRRWSRRWRALSMPSFSRAPTTHRRAAVSLPRLVSSW
jgi:hypothetical protein